MKFDITAALQKMSRNGLRLDISGKNGAAAGRFGGLPDVPADFVWPVFETFLVKSAIINLSMAFREAGRSGCAGLCKDAGLRKGSRKAESGKSQKGDYIMQYRNVFAEIGKSGEEVQARLKEVGRSALCAGRPAGSPAPAPNSRKFPRRRPSAWMRKTAK